MTLSRCALKKLPVILALSFALAACAPRGEIVNASADPSAHIQSIWSATFRQTEAALPGQRSAPRPDLIKFERYAISIPSIHQAGQIEWPKADIVPDAKTSFVTVGHEILPDQTRFAAAVAQSDVTTAAETMLFVHGYNYTHGEAVYQLAQITHDFEVTAPAVVFSWPSAAKAAGYLYDRDSVLIARDQLAEVITALTGKPGRRLVIVAHSMGNFLVMETLRQMEIEGKVDLAAKINALVMVSPDIDGELFYTQASRLKNLPEPTIILAAEQDRALRISALLTGRTNRLGSSTDRSAVRDLPIIVIDASAVSAGGLSHSVAFTSPAAIAILKSARGGLLPGEVTSTGVIRLVDVP